MAATKRSSGAARKAWLLLETGDAFEGRGFGAGGERFGEVVFNTGNTGYVEILTDPSYHSQIVVMTHPQIGNHGVQRKDFERDRVAVSGFCVAELTDHGRHPASGIDLDALLRGAGVPGISGLPTREIAVLLRRRGSLRGLVTARRPAGRDLARLKRQPTMSGRDLVGEVTVERPAVWGESWEGARRLAVVDFGVKRSLLDELSALGCALKLFPAGAAAKDLLSDDPDGLVLSNGPGDPGALRSTVGLVRGLLSSGKPMLGICLGHQLMGLAAGGRRYKLPFGHHGINHPVRERASGRVLITSQNHGFSIRADSLDREWSVTHESLNDGTLEGFRHKRKPLTALQFHPEAGPGPTETRSLIREFVESL